EKLCDHPAGRLAELGDLVLIEERAAVLIDHAHGNEPAHCFSESDPTARGAGDRLLVALQLVGAQPTHADLSDLPAVRVDEGDLLGRETAAGSPEMLFGQVHVLLPTRRGFPRPPPAHG